MNETTSAAAPTTPFQVIVKNESRSAETRRVARVDLTSSRTLDEPLCPPLVSGVLVDLELSPQAVRAENDDANAVVIFASVEGDPSSRQLVRLRPAGVAEQGRSDPRLPLGPCHRRQIVSPGERIA
jgi:hypothetical protein